MSYLRWIFIEVLQAQSTSQKLPITLLRLHVCTRMEHNAVANRIVRFHALGMACPVQ